jgi:hypothetical protein
MNKPATAQGFLDPALSVKVGQVLSMAEKMGMSIQISGTAADISFWQTGMGFGNPGALTEAADKWNALARKITDSITALNTGANTALGRGASGTDPSTGPAQGLLPVGSGDIWQGESAKNFALYVGSLNQTLLKLNDDATAVGKGLTEAAGSCVTFWIGIAAAIAAPLTAAIALPAAATALVITATTSLAAATAFISWITTNLDKFQQVKTDIVSGRVEPPNTLSGERIVPVGG